MKQTIYKNDFRDAFARIGRKDQFSYEGLGALYDWLQETMGDDYELDALQLCHEFAEEDVESALKSYCLESIEQLRDQTSVVWEGDGKVLHVIY